MFNKAFIFLLVLIALAGCKADKMEINLNEKALQSAKSGQEEMVSFEATFSTFGELDDAQKAQVNAIEDILENYIELEGFELASTDMGFEVIIEGEIPVSTDSANSSAYFLLITQSDILTDYSLIQLKTGSSFDKMSTEMKAINFMLAPDAFHPTTFTIKGKKLHVIAIAAENDGEAHLIWKGKVDGRERFKYAGGIFDKTGAGLFFK